MLFILFMKTKFAASLPTTWSTCQTTYTWLTPGITTKGRIKGGVKSKVSRNDISKKIRMRTRKMRKMWKMMKKGRTRRIQWWWGYVCTYSTWQTQFALNFAVTQQKLCSAARTTNENTRCQRIIVIMSDLSQQIGKKSRKSTRITSTCRNALLCTPSDLIWMVQSFQQNSSLYL